MNARIFNRKESRLMKLLKNIDHRLLIIILLSPFWLTGCGPSSDPPARLTEKSTIAVTVVQVQAREIAETVKILGDIIPLYQVDIYSKINGLVRSESAAIGKYLQKGEVLAEVEQDIPGMEFTPVKIEATRAGIITMDAVEVGTRVSPQQKLYTLQETRQVYMTGRVIESIHSQIRTGTAVTVTVDALPGESFSGKISEVSPVVDPFSRMGSVKVLLENRAGRLKAGMFARCDLQINPHPALLVPMDAIIPRGVNRYLFVVENDTARQVKVETGNTREDWIEIFNALQAGDRVVVIGQNLLNDRSPVRIVEEK